MQRYAVWHRVNMDHLVELFGHRPGDGKVVAYRATQHKFCVPIGPKCCVLGCDMLLHIYAVRRKHSNMFGWIHAGILSVCVSPSFIKFIKLFSTCIFKVPFRSSEHINSNLMSTKYFTIENGVEINNLNFLSLLPRLCSYSQLRE